MLQEDKKGAATSTLEAVRIEAFHIQTHFDRSPSFSILDLFVGITHSRGDKSTNRTPHRVPERRRFGNPEEKEERGGFWCVCVFQDLTKR